MRNVDLVCISIFVHWHLLQSEYSVYLWLNWECVLLSIKYGVDSGPWSLSQVCKDSNWFKIRNVSLLYIISKKNSIFLLLFAFLLLLQKYKSGFANKKSEFDQCIKEFHKKNIDKNGFI